MMSIRSWLHRCHLKKRYQRGIDALLAGLEDPDPRARFDAANTLWGLAGELDPGDRARCLPVLQAVAAADAEPTTRANAICALVALDAPSAVDTALAAMPVSYGDPAVQTHDVCPGQDSASPPI